MKNGEHYGDPVLLNGYSYRYGFGKAFSVCPSLIKFCGRRTPLLDDSQTCMFFRNFWTKLTLCCTWIQTSYFWDLWKTFGNFLTNSTPLNLLAFLLNMNPQVHQLAGTTGLPDIHTMVNLVGIKFVFCKVIYGNNCKWIWTNDRLYRSFRIDR